LRTLQQPHTNAKSAPFGLIFGAALASPSNGSARGLRESPETWWWGPRGSILNRHPWLPLKTALLTLTHSFADTAICRLEPPPGDFSEVSLHRARGAAGDQGAGLDGRAHAARVQAVHVLRPPRAERVQALPALPGRPHAPALPGALRCFETPFSRTDETTWEEHQYTLHPVGAFRRSGVRGLLWQTLCTRVGQSRSRSDVMIFAHQRTVLVRSAFRRSLRPNATHDCTLATARRACRPHVVSGRSALCNAAALALALPWRGICPHPAVSTASTLLICITEMGCVLLRCEHNSGSNHATLRRATSNTFHRLNPHRAAGCAAPSRYDTADVSAYTHASSACGA
jgi:hypothetical protein